MSAAPPTPAAVRALAEALDLLAEVFLVPSADVRARAAALVGSGPWPDPELDELARPLRTLSAAEPDGTGTEYARLFLHGRPVTAHPYESFYRSGELGDGECLAELAALLDAAGVTPDAGHPVAPDHLGVELDLLALLMHGVAVPGLGRGQAEQLRALARLLVERHLAAFVPAFAARLAGLEPPATYRTAAAAAVAAVRAAAALLAAGEGGRPVAGSEPDIDPKPVPRETRQTKKEE